MLKNKRFRFYKWLSVNLLLLGCGASQANDPMTLQAARSNGAFVASWEVPGGWSLRLKMASPEVVPICRLQRLMRNLNGNFRLISGCDL